MLEAVRRSHRGCRYAAQDGCGERTGVPLGLAQLPSGPTRLNQSALVGSVGPFGGVGFICMGGLAFGLARGPDSFHASLWGLPF